MVVIRIIGSLWKYSWSYIRNGPDAQGPSILILKRPKGPGRYKFCILKTCKQTTIGEHCANIVEIKHQCRIRVILIQVRSFRLCFRKQTKSERPNLYHKQTNSAFSKLAKTKNTIGEHYASITKIKQKCRIYMTLIKARSFRL